MQPSLRFSDLSQYRILFPPLPEQQAIANFLDRKTAQIDKLIAKKQRQIELLKEQKQAFINQAVTKGLNPDANMKDSGIEWLGEIPEEWEIKRFKYCANISSGQVDPKEFPYKSMTLIAPNHIESNTGKLQGIESAEEQGAESGKYMYQSNDVLYSKIRPELRKACLAIGEGLCSADMYPISTTKDLLPEFLLYLILSNGFSHYATERSMRVAMPKINRKDLNEYKFAYPNISEQQEILLSIDAKSSDIDNAIQKSTYEIQLFKEYRNTLVSNVVTGKIDVR